MKGTSDNMAEYLENKAIGKYFRTQTDQYVGSVRIFGNHSEYRVIEGIPEAGAMLEVIDVENGILMTRVNNALFENGRDFLQ